MRILVIVALILLSSFFPGCEPNYLGKASYNKSLLTDYHAAWSSGKTEELNRLLSTDFVLHFIGGTDYKGIDGAKAAIMETKAAFPDWKEEVLDVISEESKVATRFHSTGTHQGRYGDLDSTGNKIDMLEASIFRIEDGKIAEQWAFWDEILFQQQLRKKM